MNTRAVNQAAGVIARAMENGYVTPAGWATALESAGLLMSPETAADMASVSTDAVQVAECAVEELKREHEESARLRDRIAALEVLVKGATEFRVWEPGYGLYVRRAPGATGFAILEARRTSHGRRAWTAAGLRYCAVLSDAELFCWPDAESAVAEARRVMPGAVVREDEPAVSPEGEHYAAVHHEYRIPHDLPPIGGPQ